MQLADLSLFDQATQIVALNVLLLRLSLKVPEFNDPAFLDSLPGNQPEPETKPEAATTTLSDELAQTLSARLIGLFEHPPQRRGYEYERFLTELFAAYGLTPRAPFKLTGEQIDGSFKLHGETYLVEAKWQAGRTGQADLLTFSGKVSGKAPWTRGLFISNLGFSEDGLKAFAGTVALTEFSISRWQKGPVCRQILRDTTRSGSEG